MKAVIIVQGERVVRGGLTNIFVYLNILKTETFIIIVSNNQRH